MQIVNDLEAMRENFDNGTTQSYKFRIEQLQKLKKVIIDNEHQIYKALYSDLHKSKEESWVTENGFLLAEINMALRKLSGWMKPERVRTNLLNFPSRSFILPEPLGVVLIISPWNYPLHLLLAPLVGAIAAGNCVVLKTSEFAPHTSSLLKVMIESVFNKNYILLVEGEGEIVVPAMTDNFTFDHIFYTGSTEVGKKIYESAAKRLVPVTLELGGKSPCIIEDDANIKIAAKRIALPKFSNAGQMCVAPDYVLVHHSKKDKFIKEIIKYIDRSFNDSYASEEYGRIINLKQFDRLSGHLKNNSIIYGGNSRREDLYIEPTILEITDKDSRILKEEIFGPILPVISFKAKNEALEIIRKNKNPLSFYIFTSSESNENYWLKAVPSGGGCINNASWHLTNPYLPFGGRGLSGTGNYHGKFSFDAFSHRKGFMKTPVWFDPSMKYPPFKGKLNILKMIIGK